MDAFGAEVNGDYVNWYAVFAGQTGYPQPPEDNRWLIETYQPSTFCPTCNIGKIQANPFMFKSEPKSIHSQFIGLNWVFDEIFIRNDVKTIFEERSITGMEFIRPLLYKDRTDLKSVWQMIVRNHLPEQVVATNLRAERCEMPTDEELVKFLKANKSRLVEGPFCGKKKYNIPKDKLIFHDTAFTKSPDIIKTKDWFGSGGSSNQLIIISERVKEIIDEYKWRGLFYIPVELIVSCT